MAFVAPSFAVACPGTLAPSAAATDVAISFRLVNSTMRVELAKKQSKRFIIAERAGTTGSIRLDRGIYDRGKIYWRTEF
jgi:hypothetical protein